MDRASYYQGLNDARRELVAQKHLSNARRDLAFKTGELKTIDFFTTEIALLERLIDQIDTFFNK